MQANLCTAAPFDQELYDYKQCTLPAVFTTREEDSDGALHWRGDYCQQHAEEEQEAHQAWEFRKI